MYFMYIYTHWNIYMYAYMQCIYMYTHHILFNHSSVHILTYVHCFYLLTIVNNVVLNIGVAEVCV